MFWYPPLYLILPVLSLHQLVTYKELQVHRELPDLTDPLELVEHPVRMELLGQAGQAVLLELLDLVELQVPRG